MGDAPAGGVLATPVATEAAPGFSETARPASLGLAESIVTRAELVRNGGETRFEMRLDPPELGTVWVRLSDSPRGVVAHIVAASTAAHQALEGGLPGLRDALQQADVQLSGFELAQGESSGQETPQQRSRDHATFASRAAQLAPRQAATAGKLNTPTHSGIDLLV